MLKLDFNERADSTPPWLKVFTVDVSCLWKYPDRQKIEQLLAKRFNTSKKNIFLSNGGDEAIEILFKICKLTDKSIMLPTPAFSQYTHQLKIWKIKHILIAGMPDLSINIQVLKKQLMPNQWLIITRPNNPTGECISHEVLIDLITTAQRQGAKVFLDEAYIEFHLEKNDINYALTYDNVVSLRTFSKAYGLAGARLGYLMGNSALIDEFKTFAMPFNINQVSLQLAELAIRNLPEVAEYCSKIYENRKIVYALLQSCAIEVFDGKGNFLLLKLMPKLKKLLTMFMRKNDIQIKSDVNELENWVRITIPENIVKLMDVLRTVFKPEIIGFDMDGVLIDTSKSYDACIMQTVQHFTQNKINVSSIIELREQGGFNNDWMLSMQLIEQAGISVEYNTVIEQFQIFYNTLKLYEVNLLTKKNAAAYFNKNFITAIITGRPKLEASDGVKQLNINPDYIISAADVSLQKPSPQGINWLKATTTKTHMWFCGDTVDDMQAGMASGCVCIGIGQNAANLYQAGADLVLDNINQLSELL